MSYQRLYPQRINWEDEPSLATPINQVNLNKMDSALFGIDGRVVELDENKVGKSDTFNTSRNGVVPKPTQADITNEKVLRADGSWVEQSGGGGGGGGHTYVDKDDEQMPPRGKAKFTGGLNLTDDSENNRTIVDDNYEIIPWTTWKEYSDAEKAEHPNAIITGAPDCDGTLEIEFMKDAWTNPNPAQAFPATESDRTITLDTDGNYDKVLLIMGFNTSYPDYQCSFIFEKGKNGFASTTTTKASGSHMTMMKRNIVYVSDTRLTIGDCEYADEAGNYSTAGNTNLIPLKVYVFKDDLTAKIKAIAHDVSTDASKCMLSNGGNVEDAIEGLITTRLANKSGFSVTANVPLEVAIDIPSVPGYKCIGALTFQTYVQSNSTEYVSAVRFNSTGTQMVMKFVSSASRTDGNASVNMTLLYVKEFT